MFPLSERKEKKHLAHWKNFLYLVLVVGSLDNHGSHFPLSVLLIEDFLVIIILLLIEFVLLKLS